MEAGRCIAALFVVHQLGKGEENEEGECLESQSACVGSLVVVSW